MVQMKSAMMKKLLALKKKGKVSVKARRVRGSKAKKRLYASAKIRQKKKQVPTVVLVKDKTRWHILVFPIQKLRSRHLKFLQSWFAEHKSGSTNRQLLNHLKTFQFAMGLRSHARASAAVKNLMTKYQIIPNSWQAFAQNDTPQDLDDAHVFVFAFENRDQLPCEDVKENCEKKCRKPQLIYQMIKKYNTQKTKTSKLKKKELCKLLSAASIPSSVINALKTSPRKPRPSRSPPKPLAPPTPKRRPLSTALSSSSSSSSSSTPTLLTPKRRLSLKSSSPKKSPKLPTQRRITLLTPKRRPLSPKKSPNLLTQRRISLPPSSPASSRPVPKPKSTLEEKLEEYFKEATVLADLIAEVPYELYTNGVNRQRAKELLTELSPPTIFDDANRINVDKKEILKRLMAEYDILVADDEEEEPDDDRDYHTPEEDEEKLVESESKIAKAHKMYDVKKAKRDAERKQSMARALRISRQEFQALKKSIQEAKESDEPYTEKEIYDSVRDIIALLTANMITPDNISIMSLAEMLDNQKSRQKFLRTFLPKEDEGDQGVTTIGF